MKVLIINNLTAGLRDGAIYDFVRILARDADEYVIRSTDGTTRIQNLLDDHLQYDLVVASGGDSTVSAVAYELRYSDIPILPFPAGTANLLAVNLDTPEEPSALAKMARELKTDYYDVGEISFESEGKPVTTGFAVISGAGFDAEVMRNAQNLKERLGPMSYYTAAAMVHRPTFAHFRITLDNEVWEIDGIAVLLINFAEIAEDISIIHENNPKDGLFEVVVIKKQHPIELLPTFITLLLDSAGKFPDRADAFETRLSSTVSVETDAPLELQLDGELPFAHTPFEARVLPGAARMVIA